ncbi:hypothetical protein N657DRAFT_642312 [Parathielavia appendiculata]|uniref:Uncharacterized protein n=1 Tax=Parathielavia appendiculata TaxID=2587402 RepID=A0AAN6U327_9PEZI|nr:hypothetical protein N657DRAFT_642312 [Parathielavia appendiculata]
MPNTAAFPSARDANTRTEYVKDTASPSMSTSVVWIVASVVGGIIGVGVSFTFLMMYYTRRRQYRRYQELHPYLSRDEIIKRQKMNRVDLFLEEEERRRQMIRKSLAARSTDSSGSSLSAMMDQANRELRELERQESTRLKEDWKRWEAQVRHERSMSAGQHPAASAASQVPILAIPSPAKHRRMPSMSPNSSAPVPPRHPGRRSAS